MVKKIKNNNQKNNTIIKNNIKNKKAIFYSIDAMIAVFIFVSAILILYNLDFNNYENNYTTYTANDLLNSISSIKVKDSNNQYIKELIANNTIEEKQYNKNILELIGEFWSEGKTDIAKKIFENITSTILTNDSNYEISLYINGEKIFSKGKSKNLTESRASRLLSGINKSQPVRGYSSRLYFSNSNNRTTSSYIFFGGFIGQGNLTFYSENLPSDVTQDILELYMEASMINNFSIYINNNYCNSFSPKKQNMTAEKFDLYSCKSFITPGKNSFKILFNKNFNESFIGGGFIKIKFITNNYPPFEYGKKTYNFPKVEGIPNIFDSFYIPGTLNKMNITLKYKVNKTSGNTTFFLTLGNITVYNETNITDENIVLDDTFLSSKINYSEFSKKNIPLRFGLEGANYTSVVEEYEESDTILVTDVSGSMGWCGEYAVPYVCNYYCWTGWWWGYWTSCNVPDVQTCENGGDVCNRGDCAYGTSNHYLDCNRTRLEIAKEADNLSVSIILSKDVTRVGTVSYYSQVDSVQSLTNNSQTLYNEINSYTAGGGTCICCGIYRAYDLYDSLSNNRNKFMIVLSDGDANYECSGPGDYYGSSASTADAAASTIAAGQYACNNNVSVFTIGFGSDISAEGVNTLKQTACNESMYYDASNTSELYNIYDNISKTILEMTKYTSQKIESSVKGLNATLYDSKIEFEFTPEYQNVKIDEIPITLNTDQFNSCTKTITINPSFRILEGKVTSYSDEHWTALVKSNNNVSYNLTEFGTNYINLGDPFIVNIPLKDLKRGDNTLEILTADTPQNFTGCSNNDSFIYTVAINVSTTFSPILEKADGCNWTVLQENNENFIVKIPQNYNGTKQCYYENATYDNNDVYDVAAYNLFSQLDVDNNGKIDVYLTEGDLNVEALVVSDVPSLWGPALFEVRVSS